MKYGHLLHKAQKILKVGAIWEVIKNINGTVQAIGLALLVIFFLVGIIKTCRKFCRSKKTRTSFKIIYKICTGEGSNNLWIRINVSDI